MLSILYSILFRKPWNKDKAALYIRLMANLDHVLFLLHISWRNMHGRLINVCSLWLLRRKIWKSGITILCRCKNYSKEWCRSTIWVVNGVTPTTNSNWCSETHTQTQRRQPHSRNQIITHKKNQKRK